MTSTLGPSARGQAHAPRITAPPAPTEDVCLRDGLAVSVRTVTPEDEDAVWEFLTNLSVESRRLRFFGVAIDLRGQAHRGAAGDDADHHGILAIAPGRGVVGHAVYVRAPRSQRAEIAVVVSDDLHHLGLATLLIIRLGQVAERRQVTRFFAEVLPENRQMLAVFRHGFAAVTVRSRDAIEVEFPTSAWRSAQARFGGDR